jgi:hypothetical protein
MCMLRGAIDPRHALTLLSRWPAVDRVTRSMSAQKMSLFHTPKHARLSSTPSLGFELALEQGLSGAIAANGLCENTITTQCRRIIPVATPCTIRCLLASLSTSPIYSASNLKHHAFAGDLGVLGTMKMDGGGEGKDHGGEDGWLVRQGPGRHAAQVGLSSFQRKMFDRPSAFHPSKNNHYHRSHQHQHQHQHHH